MVDASLSPLFVLIQYFFDIIAAHPAMHVLIDLNDRPQTAAADAPDRFQGIAPIRRGVSVMKVKRFHDAFVNTRTSSDVASGPETDRYNIAAARFQAKGCIEGRHAVYFAERHSNFRCQVSQGGPWQVIVSPLNGLQDHDQIFFVIAELVCDHIVEFSKIDLYFFWTALNCSGFIHLFVSQAENQVIAPEAMNTSCGCGFSRSNPIGSI
jgi:hypothetical protein